MQSLKGHWQLFAITVVVFALWQTLVVVPLKILVIFLHEFSHALATVLTGGQVEQLSVSPQQGGFVISRGGSRFVILTAGYLGSLGLGALLLVAALRTQADRLIAGVCGAVLLGVAVLYVRDLFALGFCGVTGAALIAIARYLPHQVSDMVLRVIGLTSLIYVPYDIFDDTIARSDLRSDAYMLAEEIGGTTLLWGGLWFVASLWVIYLVLRHGLGPRSNIDFNARV